MAQNIEAAADKAEATETQQPPAPAEKPEAKAEDVKTPETTAYEAEIEKLKKALSKANSEAAENKRKYLSTLDEAQRAEEERAEKEKAREARIAELEAKERFSTYKSRLMEAGYDTATAEIMAKALPDGVGDAYFEAVKTYNGNQAQAIKNAALDNQPGLSVGMPPTGTEKKDERINKILRYAGVQT